MHWYKFFLFTYKIMKSDDENYVSLIFLLFFKVNSRILKTVPTQKKVLAEQRNEWANISSMFIVENIFKCRGAK